MNKRTNVVQSDESIRALDPRDRQRLRKQLRAGYKANGEESLKLAAEWFPVEEEASRKSERADGGTR
jgi:hypothetical protein